MTKAQPSLLELAERCEKATGPDRELDAHIHAANGRPFEMEYWTEADTTPQRNLSKVPLYTRSIDAALTLVPEICRFNLNKRPFGSQYHAQVWFSRYYETVNDMPNAWAATAALALCAAALRATEHGQ